VYNILMNNKIIGSLLLTTAILVTLAMIINHHILWLAVDLLAIAVCGVGGILLLRRG